MTTAGWPMYTQIIVMASQFKYLLLQCTVLVLMCPHCISTGVAWQANPYDVSFPCQLAVKYKTSRKVLHHLKVHVVVRSSI